MSSQPEHSGKPAASVVIAVYNAEKYLAQAIESVLNQTFSNFELLLLNDGSTDDSLRIMESFAAKDDRCRVFTGSNRGIVATRNWALELARSPFIVTMDADDICHPQRIEKQLAFLIQHPDHVVVGSRALFIDPDGMPLLTMVECLTHEDINRELLSRRLGIVHPSSTIRMSALEAIDGYHPYRHAEDLDLFLRLAEIGRLANLPEPLLCYRQHVSSVSHRYILEQSQMAEVAIMDASKRRGLALDEVKRNMSPPAVRQTDSEIHRKWAWWAFKGGYRDTARKHAFLALKGQPTNLENWRVVACTVRGY